MLLFAPIGWLMDHLGYFPPKPADAYIDEYCEIMEAFQKGDIAFLEQFESDREKFPDGNDRFVNRRWIDLAIDCGNLDSFKWVLDRVKNLDSIDDEGFSALTSAISNEADDKFHKDPDTAFEMVRILVEKGADVNLLHSLDETPLHYAAKSGSLRTIDLLLQCGADPHAYTSDYTPETPVHWAQRAERNDVVELLVKSKRKYARRR